MAVRVSHTNNSSGHDGTYVYRSTSPMDPQNLPVPIADAPPVALGATFEYIDNADNGTYYYRTQDHEGGLVSAVSSEVSIQIGFNASVGDEVEGGIYAGVDTINGTDYHIIAGKADSEVSGIKWGNYKVDIPGAASDSDGLANTQAILADPNGHPAAAHCWDYNAVSEFDDWHMPALNQLLLISSNLSGHPEFSLSVGSGTHTWTSTQSSISAAKVVLISDGGQSAFMKTYANPYSRPIRRLPA